MSAINATGGAGGGTLPDKRYQKPTVAADTNETKKTGPVKVIVDSTRQNVDRNLGRHVDFKA